MVFGSLYIINNNKTLMNQASQYLLSLAKQKIKPYVANSQAKAAMITGSTATGQADFYSDVEMFIYYEQLPPKEELNSLVSKIKVLNLSLLLTITITVGLENLIILMG